MIVAVCSDKGSPGVTTAATTLAMVWPGERVLLEADPSGGDLALRARRPDDDGLLAAEPGLLALAADARTGRTPDALSRYVQPTAWGVDVVVGPASAPAYAPMRNLWPAVAAAVAAWQGTAVADLGRLYPGTPAVTVAREATAVLMLTGVSVEALYHLRDRVIELAHTIGDPSRARNPVAVGVVARPGEATAAARQVTRMLEATGIPIPVAGTVALDPQAAHQLRHGRQPRRMLRTDLFRSAIGLAATVCQWWPQLAAHPAEGVDADAVSAGTSVMTSAATVPARSAAAVSVPGTVRRSNAAGGGR